MVKSFGIHIRIKTSTFRCDGSWSGDTLPYAYVRKQYTRSHAYPKNTQRINPLKNEKAAIIMLRKHGYPTNMIANALGRSFSYIHRVIRTALLRLTLRGIDMRKLPSKTRLYTSAIRWRNLQKYLPLWEKFILGEEGEPP